MNEKPVTTLSARARAVRMTLATVFFALLVAGTFYWDDHEFPFGPFRMFSTSTPPNGNVHVAAIEVRFPDGSWRRVPLESNNVGINRAEAEGQMPRFRAQPQELRQLIEAHDRLRPREPRWTGIRLIQQYLKLRNREYVGTDKFVVAEWSRP